MGKPRFKYGTYARYRSIDPLTYEGYVDSLFFILDRHLIYKGSVLVTNSINIDSSILAGGGKVLTITDKSNVDSSGNPAVYKVYDKEFIDTIGASFINKNHGFAFCVSASPMDSSTKEATPSDGSVGFNVETGGIVAVRFSNLVTDAYGDVTLTIGEAGPYPIYYKDEPIVSDVIMGGDTATMMFDGEKWNVISVDKGLTDSSISADYDTTIHKPIEYTVNTQDASITSREIISDNFTTASDRILAVKFTNGIIYKTSGIPTITVKDSYNNIITSSVPILWHGNNIVSGEVLAGDTVNMIYDGVNFHVLSIDRKIDHEPISASNNFITSGAVYNAIEESTVYWQYIGQS